GGAVIHQRRQLCECACFEQETLILTRWWLALIQANILVLIRNQTWFGLAGVPSPPKNKL
ncbi:unnamed protein product, partial [Ectocarpus sp. 6 AP-2014]